MKSAVASAALALACAACSPTPSPTPTAKADDAHAAAQAALGVTYEVKLTGGPTAPCQLKLDPATLATTTPACQAQYPLIQHVTKWKATEGGSLSLLAANGTSLADFSPVQDGTGVYLRGGADGAIYELWPPQ
ncbi:MAG TPA: hypothetical protein VG942_18245 [Hyphomonadaceae bacterium]|nr:hypothetical protein [Hyphomonadaceae bacterium]